MACPPVPSRKPLVVLALVLLANPARGQQGLSPPPPPPDVPQVAEAFFEKFLSFDEARGQVLRGRQRHALTSAEFYTAVGRPDLVARSEAAMRQRIILGVAGGVLIVGGLVVGAVLLATLPDLNSGFCVENLHNYNAICVPRYQSNQSLAGFAIAGGLGIGGLLATLANASRPDVLSSEETLALISRYNASLLAGSHGEETSALRLRVAPYLSPQGGGMLTTLQF